MYFKVTILVHGKEGLELALAQTKALYEGDLNSLSAMPTHEVSQLFGGAAIKEILPEPGINMLQLAMKVGCFPTESNLFLYLFFASVILLLIHIFPSYLLY